MNQANQIFDEILQMIKQYKAEVPGRGRGWPASIRERVRVLSRLDVSNGEISRKTGIPGPTVYIWTSGKVFRKKPKKASQGKFLPIEVNPKPEPKRIENERDLTVGKLADKLAVSERQVAAILPGGIRVEGLSLDSLIELSRRMSS